MQPAGTQLIAHLAQQAAIGHAFVAAREPGVEEFGFPSAAMCAGKSLQGFDLLSGGLIVLRHGGFHVKAGPPPCRQRARMGLMFGDVQAWTWNGAEELRFTSFLDRAECVQCCSRERLQLQCDSFLPVRKGCCVAGFHC